MYPVLDRHLLAMRRLPFILSLSERDLAQDCGWVRRQSVPGMPNSRHIYRSHTRRSLRHRWAVFALAVLAGLVFLAAPAGAHPLGNFTVNRYARLEVSAGHVRVHYVLDLAEIPAFQVRNEVQADPRRFGRDLADSIRRGLRLDLEGRRVEVRIAGQRLTQPPGHGGLPTLRLEVDYDADVSGLNPDRMVTATFEDTNEPDRLGWREVVAVARGDAVIVQSDVPSEDASDELRLYPEDLSRSPLDRARRPSASGPDTSKWRRARATTQG